MSKRPLEGIRVVALEQVWAGPITTRELAALGAEVIRVESAARTDSEPATRATSSAFSQLNRGKRGISLDIRDEEGRALLRRLIAISDIVVENFSRRVLAGFSLDYESLLPVKPDLIMLSVTGYGHSGPYADYRSFGPNAEAMGGLVWHTGSESTRLVFPGAAAFGDATSGHFGALSVVAALFRRARTNRGAYIDLTQYEVMASFMSEEIIAQQQGEEQSYVRANDHTWMAPHGVYECAGTHRWVAIAVADDAQWRSLVSLMGSPEWAASPHYGTRSGRYANRLEIDKQLDTWTRTRERDELVAELTQVGVPAAIVRDARDVVLDHHFWRRGALELVDLSAVSDEVGVAPHLAAPWRMARGLEPAPPAAGGARPGQRVRPL